MGCGRTRTHLSGIHVDFIEFYFAKISVYRGNRRKSTSKVSILVKALSVGMLNGDILNFSSLPDGAILPRSAISNDWIARDVERLQGQLHLSVILPHGT